MASDRNRAIPTERPPSSDKDSANISSGRSSYFSRSEMLLLHSSSASFVLTTRPTASRKNLEALGIELLSIPTFSLNVASYVKLALNGPREEVGPCIMRSSTQGVGGGRAVRLSYQEPSSITKRNGNFQLDDSRPFQEQQRHKFGMRSRSTGHLTVVILWELKIEVERFLLDVIIFLGHHRPKRYFYFGSVGLGPSIVMTTKVSRTLYDDDLTRLTQIVLYILATGHLTVVILWELKIEVERFLLDVIIFLGHHRPKRYFYFGSVGLGPSIVMTTKVSRTLYDDDLTRLTQIVLYILGDEATLVRGHFQTQVFQQSVTLTAKMWPEDNGTAPPSSPGGWKWGSWRIPNEHLPLLVGTVCGGALILLVLLAAIVWRCCVMPRRDKAYCARLDKEMLARQRSGIPPLPSHSAVFAAPKSGQWAYSSRLVGPPANPPLVAPPAHWFYNSRVLSPANLERIDPGPIPRSVSCVSTQLHNEALPVAVKVCDKRRPMSQPIRFGPCDLAPKQEARHPPLPEISEFTAPNTQYASSSILDEVGARGGEAPAGNMVLKTRSLPAWVRSKSRPLSTEDDLAELYAKVNFSKKRKNRMRNDEAAIIALSKSRSQYLHKDTDSLVDNEAVIVYDERTAL
uniref:Uncharacterized protein n=1 Tax=Timema cristinae TaxID=61476 RepID=A0A7R9CU64_TIMCR|nr:unnamed protein product [Timema cristinae]